MPPREAPPVDIAYLITSLETGGAQVGMERLLQGLDSRRYQVEVVALKEGSQPVTPELPSTTGVTVLGVEGLVDFLALRRLKHHLSGADIVVCSLYHSVLLGALLRNPFGNRHLVAWVHNEKSKNRIRRWSFQKAVQRADLVLADSERVASLAMDDLGIKESSLRVIPLAGLDADRFSPASGGDRDKVIVGTLGTLTPQKNHATVLEVASELREEPIKFQIAGDGPLRADLSQEIQRRKLENIELLGFVEDSAEFLQSVDIYFQPSLHEGLCITVAEAMATALPVVASPVGGISDSVVPGVTGFLAGPRETEEFARFITTLAHNRKRREMMGKAGRDRALDRYTREALVTRFDTAMREVLDAGDAFIGGGMSP